MSDELRAKLKQVSPSGPTMESMPTQATPTPTYTCQQKPFIKKYVLQIIVVVLFAIGAYIYFQQNTVKTNILNLEESINELIQKDEDDNLIEGTVTKDIFFQPLRLKTHRGSTESA